MPFDKSELEMKLVNMQVYKVILLLHAHNSAYYKVFYDQEILWFQLFISTVGYHIFFLVILLSKRVSSKETLLQKQGLLSVLGLGLMHCAAARKLFRSKFASTKWGQINHQ